MLSAAVATFLDGLGLVDYRPTQGGGDCFLSELPPEPAAAVCVRSLPGQGASGTWGYDTPGINVLVRADSRGPRAGYELARGIYSALHGLHDTALDAGGADETHVVGCLADQSDPIDAGAGPDGLRVWSLNFTLDVRALTTNRT